MGKCENPECDISKIYGEVFGKKYCYKCYRQIMRGLNKG
jgi:hypothetical protein